MERVALPEQVPLPTGALMAVWVNDHHKDYPNGFVLRPPYAMHGGAVVAGVEAWYAKTADELRAILPAGITCLARE